MDATAAPSQGPARPDLIVDRDRPGAVVAGMLLVASDTLLRRAYARPVLRGRYAAQVSLECPVFGVGQWEKTVNFQEGVGGWERVSFIVRSRLEAEQPEVPVDGLALPCPGLTGDWGRSRV